MRSQAAIASKELADLSSRIGPSNPKWSLKFLPGLDQNVQSYDTVNLNAED